MSVLQVTRQKMIDAASAGRRVDVVRMATSKPRIVEGAVVMTPCVSVSYRCDGLHDPIGGDEPTIWAMQEVVFADDEGGVDLSGALYAELEDRGMRCRFMRRSGSF